MGGPHPAITLHLTTHHTRVRIPLAISPPIPPDTSPPLHSLIILSMPKTRKTSDDLTASTLRRYILLTLSHNEADGRNLTKDQVHDRVSSKFNVLRAIACTETHQEGGHHYHYAFENTDASKNTATKACRCVGIS